MSRLLIAVVGLMAATASGDTGDTIQVPVTLLQDTARFIGMQKRVIDKQADAIEALELEMQLDHKVMQERIDVLAGRKDCA